MRRNQICDIVSFIVCLFFCSCNTQSLPDLGESFSYTDKRPFGDEVAYSMVKDAYKASNFTVSQKEFSDEPAHDNETGSLYFSVGKNFIVTAGEAEAIMDYAYKGNTFFISADEIDRNLLARLYVKMHENFSLQYRGGQYQDASTGFSNPAGQRAEQFGYFYFPFTHYLTNSGEMNARNIGEDQSRMPNLTVLFWGKGRIFLQTAPRALSNYFLLTSDNYRYLQQVIRLLPAAPLHVYWDDLHNRDMYSRRSRSGGSSFSAIMKNPPLKRAFFIALALMLLYIFFNSKRRQRIVPVIKPVENNSIAFTQAIAGLYLGKKDNKLIAEKIITYFNEHVRSAYFSQLSLHDPGFADMLSRKSGVPRDTVDAFTYAMRRVSKSVSVSDQELLLLNSLAEKFFKNKV